MSQLFLRVGLLPSRVVLRHLLVFLRDMSKGCCAVGGGRLVPFFGDCLHQVLLWGGGFWVPNIWAPVYRVSHVLVLGLTRFLRCACRIRCLRCAGRVGVLWVVARLGLHSSVQLTKYDLEELYVPVPK